MNFAKVILTLFLSSVFFTFVAAQSETITNDEVVLMSRAGLNEELILRKIKESSAKFNTSARDLIDLKKSDVSDRIIEDMMNKRSSNETARANSKQGYSDSSELSDPLSANPTSFGNTSRKDYVRIVLSDDEALRNAKTIAINKSSLQPSRQALEKELLKKKEWKDINLNIVRQNDSADLILEIGYVSMSWITHRYVYQIYDRRSGTVILAGETTSWGSLAENLARGISKRLVQAMALAK